MACYIVPFNSLSARQHKGLFPGDTIPGDRPFLPQGKRRIIRNLPCSLNMIFYMESAGGWSVSY